MGQPNLTFAEAYFLQLKLRETQSRSAIQQRMSPEEVVETISDAAQKMEAERSPALLKDIKVSLKQIPSNMSSLAGQWDNGEGLNLLQLAIATNCSEIVEFLLTETKWYPTADMPKRNPYAHLAAILGHTECLLSVLKNRPFDYFSGSSSHTIKLPNKFKKNLRPPDRNRGGGVNKQVEKLLYKIKSSTETAEMTMKLIGTNDSQDVSDVLTGELDNLEKASKRFKPRLDKIHRFKESKDAIAAHVPQQSNDGCAVKQSERSKTTELIEGPKPGTRGCQPRHAITVHWDVFSEATSCVVKGAGQKVDVLYTNKAYQDRPGIDLASKFSNAGSTMMNKQVDTIGQPKLKKVNFHQSPLADGPVIKWKEKRKDSHVTLPKVLEPGVRGKKKYKEFHLMLDSQTLGIKEDSYSLRSKTPLTLAAQYGYLECVKMILEKHIIKYHPNMAVKEPLTLATKARCPDAILLLLNQKITRTDYQSAVLTAMREMYPDCLTALLAERPKDKQNIFDGLNSYHVLFTQSLMSDFRYEMLPVMTNALVNSSEDVNAHNAYCCFPLYTLINCAFNITTGKKILYYIDCLKILLQNKANPHFDETKIARTPHEGAPVSFTRSVYSSALNCILESAAHSTKFFENTYWSRLFMKKMVTTLTTCDVTNRRQLNDVLFQYLRKVCSLGLDRYIVRCLLRYGANPDFTEKGSYAINVYFDNILPYLATFEVDYTRARWQQELSAILLICRGMSYPCLREAEQIFLNVHLLNCPIQALPLCRSFSHLINELVMSPRPLSELVALFIWVKLRRNEKLVKKLHVPEEISSLILPQ